jgi:hypothetical protein
MAEPNHTATPSFESLADLGRKYGAQREAMRKRLIEGWTKNKPPPTEQRNAWILLVENPELIASPEYSVYVYYGLRRLLGKKPWHRRLTDRHIDALVGLCVFGGTQLGKARQFVGSSLVRTKTAEAVKQAQYRIGKRDKQR